ncbi:MAG: HAD family hydrolase [Solirubrobacterales bacterium]
MTQRRYEIPGDESFVLDHLLLDVNGTLTDRGKLITGVSERLRRLAKDLEVHLLSADTFSTLDAIAEQLQIEGRRAETGADKRALVEELGPKRCAAIGNGRNDAEMLTEVRLGICVLGPEGTYRAAIDAAEVVCGSIRSALDMLLNSSVLAATLRP